MDHLQAIKNNYYAIHDHFIPLMLSTEEPLLRDRVVKEINPIIWIAWHILRTEDMYLSTVVFAERQEFHREDWMTKLNINTSNTGTGMSVEEADALSQQVNKDVLLEYNQRVKDRSIQFVNRSVDLSDKEFSEEKDINRRLREADSFPEKVRQERAKAYSQFPLSTGVTGILMHGFMHIGQYQVITKPL